MVLTNVTVNVCVRLVLTSIYPVSSGLSVVKCLKKNGESDNLLRKVLAYK